MKDILTKKYLRILESEVPGTKVFRRDPSFEYNRLLRGPLKLKKVVSNLAETSCALRRFCLKFGDGFLCRALMKKAHVGVFCFRAARRRAGHPPLAMRMRLRGVCAASRGPGQLLIVIVATLGVVAWRTVICGPVGALPRHKVFFRFG